MNFKYELSKEHEKYLSDEVKRRLDHAPVMEVMIENYLNGIKLLFNNMEREADFRVESIIDNSDVRPNCLYQIVVYTDYNDQEKIEIQNALKNIIENVYQNLQKSKINSERIIYENKNISFDLKKLKNKNN